MTDERSGRPARGGSGDWTSGADHGGRMGGELSPVPGDEAEAAARQATGGVGVTPETGGPQSAPEQPAGAGGGGQGDAPTQQAGAIAAAPGARWSQGGGNVGAEQWEMGGSGGASPQLPGAVDDEDDEGDQRGA